VVGLVVLLAEVGERQEEIRGRVPRRGEGLRIESQLGQKDDNVILLDEGKISLHGLA
jgi:hypothetical protein